MDTSNKQESESLLERLAELKADNHAEGLARLKAINNALTPEWSESMRSRINELSKTASSPRSKLPKLYALVEEFSEIRAPFVSCKAGCSSCCKRIPVEISDLEAKHISMATGIASVNLPPGRHTSFDFQNTPCSFLVNDRCSIYPHRPYNCRSLAVVDRDALTCSDLNTELTIAKDTRAVPAVMSKAAQFDPLHRELTSRKGTVWADIRQFFPIQNAGKVNVDSSDIATEQE